ncbi:MAG TPA: hypothetical protein VGH33_01100 [Isosphaeraceae bacterium]
MRLRGSSRPIRCGLGTLVVLAVAVLAGPSRASAGCSHDAVSGKAHASILASLDRMQLPVVPARPARPCDGPSCSGSPAAPATSPIVHPPLRAERWGCVVSADSPGELAWRLSPPADAPARPVHHGLRVDRPPSHPALPHA